LYVTAAADPSGIVAVCVVAVGVPVAAGVVVVGLTGVVAAGAVVPAVLGLTTGGDPDRVGARGGIFGDDVAAVRGRVLGVVVVPSGAVGVTVDPSPAATIAGDGGD
jgi:hypothetical protein